MSFGLEPYLKKISNLEKKLEAVKTWMNEEWDDLNVCYYQDDKQNRHPRWKLKEILEGKQTSEVTQT